MKDIYIIGLSLLGLCLFSPKGYDSFNATYYSGGKGGTNSSKKELVDCFNEEDIGIDCSNCGTYVSTIGNLKNGRLEKVYTRGVVEKTNGKNK